MSTNYFFLNDIYPIIDNITENEGGLECVISINRNYISSENEQYLKYDAKTQFFDFTIFNYDDCPAWKRPKKPIDIKIELSCNSEDIHDEDITMNIAMKIIKELEKPEFNKYLTVEYDNKGYQLKRNEIEFFDNVNIYIKNNVDVKFTKDLTHNNAYVNNLGLSHNPNRLNYKECTLCEKQFDCIDLFKCSTCYELFCDECFNGYEKRDSNGLVIDYENGHEC